MLPLLKYNHTFNDKFIEHEVKMLDIDSYYELEIYCENKLGMSEKNAMFIFKTKSG